MYRYILQSGDQDLISIQDELKFIESYVFLIKARYRENFSIDIKIYKIMKTIILFFAIALAVQTSYAQKVDVKIILNAKHSVGSISSFDRSKFITIHANQTENEWDGNNFTSDLRNDFLNGYDVFLGRDTGGISWNVNQIQEDPNRAGYGDPDEIATRGQNARANFENNNHLHEYEFCISI